MDSSGEHAQTVQFSLEEDSRTAWEGSKGTDEGGGGGAELKVEERNGGDLVIEASSGSHKVQSQSTMSTTSVMAMLPEKKAGLLATLDMNDVPKEEPTSYSEFGRDDGEGGEDGGGGGGVKAGGQIEGVKLVGSSTNGDDVTDLEATLKPKLENDEREEHASAIHETTTTMTTLVTHNFLQARESADADLQLGKSAKPTLDVNEVPYAYKSAQDAHDDVGAVPSSHNAGADKGNAPHDVEMTMAGPAAQASSGMKLLEARPDSFSRVEERVSMEGVQAGNSIKEIGQTSSQMDVPSNSQGWAVVDSDTIMEAKEGLKVGATKGEKTELEMEMELFEASEQEEQARLLKPMRMEQQDEMYAGKDTQTKKRAFESPLQERQRKQSRRVHAADEKKRDEEDVCFICFDGGDLVLCDRRSCPKAYHLSCIGRDAAFFKKKGAWLCGWHFCSVCTKPGSLQCYTCPTAYCLSCINDADFLLLRKRKGLCEECLPIVSMIERNETINAEGVEVDFDDQETYECLFKEYWVELKTRLSLTMPELGEDGTALAGNNPMLQMGSDTEDLSENDDSAADTDKSDHDDLETLEASRHKRKKSKRALKESGNSEEDMEREEAEDEEDEENSDEQELPVIESWASKVLLDFVGHMKEDTRKPLTRFAVNKLLWVYIKRHNLQDLRKKSQINCDERLQNIFGKESVGQFEMFKLLQAHYPAKGSTESRKNKEASSGDDPTVEDDAVFADGVDDKSGRSVAKDRRRGRRSIEEMFERPDSSEYVAITPKNIGLIYLRRALLEDLLDDPEFDSKVVNTFVRIRVPGMSSKTETCYRLVLVTGTRVQAEIYKAGRKTTNVVLEILNLQKKEDVTVDLVSNQDFTEEECQRLRQSIKCGFIKALAVGEVEEKAIALREVKVNDWFENERQRLVNLRDRASEKGRKKELRECVEKLQELSSPAFRAAKLQARPEVSADPHMDPGYESDVSESIPLQEGYMSSRPRISPRVAWEKGTGSVGGGWENASIENPVYSGRKGEMDSQWLKPSSTWDDSSTRSRNRGRSGYDVGRSSDRTALNRDLMYSVVEEKPYSSDERDRTKIWDRDHARDRDRDRIDGYRRTSSSERGQWAGEMTNSKYSRGDYRAATTPVFGQSKAELGFREREVVAPTTPLSSSLGFITTPPSLVGQALLEKEKIWHYQDPTGTIQGPFTMEQLRKWSTTGLFPASLTIWKTGQARETSILLTDALAGTYAKDRDSWAAGGVGGSGSRVREFAGGSPTPRASHAWRSETGLPSWTGGDDGQTASRSELDQPIGGVDSIDDSRGGSWARGQSRSAYNAPPSTVGRTDEWGSTRSRVDSESWGSPRKGGSNASSWGGQDNGKSSRSNSSRSYDAPGSRDGSRSMRGPRGSKKDVPCRFFGKGYCKRGDACEFWHG